MMLPWRTRIVRNTTKKKKNIMFRENLDMEVMVPIHFKCPISLELMKDPVTLCTGMTYDRAPIEKWIEAGNSTCPVTNQELVTFDLIPNHSLRKMIQGWCVLNKSSGIQRIPTPQIPVTRNDVLDTCEKIMVATKSDDPKKVQELLQKIKNWGNDSDRNKQCIADSEMGSVLSYCFEHFASEINAALLEEIMVILTWFFPLSNENSHVIKITSLDCLIWFLKSKNLSTRQNSILLLKNLIYSNGQMDIVNSMVGNEGVFEALVGLIRDPICGITTKACLMVILRMITSTSSPRVAVSSFVDLGLVSLIIEMTICGDKSVCEKALRVLDCICDWKQGRPKAYENALVVPLLVKKMLRVSNLATEFIVSIIWKLATHGGGGGGGGSVVVEAVQVGCFQKLLVVLQVGCGGNTKGKVTELLKMMNVYRGKIECFDESSLDFNQLKKPF